jgi:hypothetical protein
MASTGLPFPTSNNAPLPIPGGFGNPTGANTGFASNPSTPFPVSSVGGPSYNIGSFGSGTSLQGLNTGLNASNPSWNQNLFNELGRAYGKGTGQMLGDIFSNGLFNPQVAAAFLNAQQPGIARGMADIQGSFADAGARFSSAAGIGLGDFQSQVQLNQQQTLASLFENAQQEQLSLLSQVLPTLHTEQANRGSGLLHDIIGGLEIVGGAVAAPFSGGASLALLGSGLGMLAGGGGGGGQGGPSPSGNNQQGLMQALQSLFHPSNSATSNAPGGVDLSGLPMGSVGSTSASTNDFIMQILQGSAGADLGGSGTAFPTDPSSTGFPF